MAEIVKITKDGVIQYPITKPEAVIDENGKNVLQLIRENGGSYDDTGIKKDISDLKEKDTEHDAELAKLSSQVGRVSDAVADKVNATYVDNAIASAITNELNSDF